MLKSSYNLLASIQQVTTRLCQFHKFRRRPIRNKRLSETSRLLLSEMVVCPCYVIVAYNSFRFLRTYDYVRLSCYNFEQCTKCMWCVHWNSQKSFLTNKIRKLGSLSARLFSMIERTSPLFTADIYSGGKWDLKSVKIIWERRQIWREHGLAPNFIILMFRPWASWVAKTFIMRLDLAMVA